MQAFNPWPLGQQIVYREVWREKIWTARPVTVVRDTPEWVALYQCAGTPWALPIGSGEPFLQCLQTGRWQLQEVALDYDGLILARPGEAHAVHVMWDRARAFTGWYVNLQEPLRRTALGFDFMDQALDLVVQPDLTWAWKDEDELQQAVALGLFSAQQAQAIRAEGERVVERLRARQSPFSDGWEHWRPPAAWPAPSWPAGWATL